MTHVILWSKECDTKQLGGIKMDWREFWKKHGGGWYDLVACCYEVICQNGNESPQFSALIEKLVSQPESPFDELVHSAGKTVEASGLNGRCSEESIRDIAGFYDGFLKKPLPRELNALDAGCWAIIAGIDKCVANSDASKTASKMGPLNNALIDEIGVYYKPFTSSIDRALANKGILYSPNERLSEKLQGLCLIRRSSRHALPEIWRLGRSVAQITEDPYAPHGSDTNVLPLKIRVGIAGCSNNLAIEVDSPDIRKRCSPDGLFGIEYEAGYDNRYEEIVGNSLKKAVDSGCHFVIFPEIVVSPQYLESIKAQLESLNHTGSLQFIVAGSTWKSTGSQNTGVNVCYVLDRYGNVQATTSKKYPFIYDRCKPHQIENLDPNDDATTMLDMHGLGRLSFAICKDLESDSCYVYQLVNQFQSDMLFVPAASNSLKGAFLDQAQLISKRLHAICCISNLCSMVPSHSGQSDISFVSAPKAPIRESHGRQPKVETVFCKRMVDEGSSNRECLNDGCLFVVDIDYGEGIGDYIPTMTARGGCRKPAE